MSKMIEYNYYTDVDLVGSKANILVENKSKKRLKELYTGMSRHLKSYILVCHVNILS